MYKIELRSLGLAPDFIVCRSPIQVSTATREKIALFCNVPVEHVLSVHDVSSIYRVPGLMLQQRLHALLSHRLNLQSLVQQHSDQHAHANQHTSSSGAISVPPVASDTAAGGSSSYLGDSLLDWEFLARWEYLAESADFAGGKPIGTLTSTPTSSSTSSSSDSSSSCRDNSGANDVEESATSVSSVARIALVGKYTDLSDAYLSVTSALRHSCMATAQQLELVLVESSHLEDSCRQTSPELHQQAWSKLKSAHGVLVPGGFGDRGIEGKVEAVRYAREERVPFLGICLGMQAAVIEYTRSFLRRPLANSREFAPEIGDEEAAVIFMPEGDRLRMGGTMRLGARLTRLQPGSLAHRLYGGRDCISERHRHRYEVNSALVPQLEKLGLRFSGRDDPTDPAVAGNRPSASATGAAPSHLKTAEAVQPLSGETPSPPPSPPRMEVVELDPQQHPFFVAVQFHPEFKSRPLRPSPPFLGERFN